MLPGQAVPGGISRSRDLRGQNARPRALADAAQFAFGGNAERQAEHMSNQGQWQVAGNAAETYERALVPAVFAAWASLVIALADPKPGERVLDIACGTGVVARLAAERVGHTGNVVGLDLNPGMLAVAASVASNQPSTS